jgi:hypothetical protein
MIMDESEELLGKESNTKLHQLNFSSSITISHIHFVYRLLLDLITETSHYN